MINYSIDVVNALFFVSCEEIVELQRLVKCCKLDYKTHWVWYRIPYSVIGISYFDFNSYYGQKCQISHSSLSKASSSNQFLPASCILIFLESLDTRWKLVSFPMFSHSGALGYHQTSCLCPKTMRARVSATQLDCDFQGPGRPYNTPDTSAGSWDRLVR